MQRAAWKQPPESLPEQTAGRQNVICLGISRPPGELRERINQRVDRMFEEGLVKETEQLLAHGLATNPTAMQALGYRQVAEYLNGVRPLNETIELVKIRTRQFAKRQMTWFKRQMRLDWISLAGDVDVCAMVRQRMR
jgi:tRNA dimethylallyltransferase